MDAAEIMTPVSLRRAALVWMTVLLTVVGVLSSLIAFLYARSEATEFLDGQLRQIALNAGDGVRPIDALAAADQDPEDQFSVTVWGADGRVLRASLPNIQIARQSRPGYANAMVDGEIWRVYTTGDAGRAVQVAMRDTVREEIATSAALAAAAPILIIIPLSWLVVRWAMNRVLGRLNTLAKDLAARSAAAAAAIPTAGIPTEVTPLVESMNGLIARLRTAVDAQKQFLADAAHELRTPLAAMQIQLDAIGAGAADAQQDRVAALASGIRRASALVNQLLQLARLDEPLPPSDGAIDLNSLLVACVGDHIVVAQNKSVDLGVNVDAPLRCHGAFEEVRVLFANLINNAVHYTPAGGKVDVSLYRHNGQSVAEVLDTGPGLPEGAEARIFDRFYRAAPPEVQGTGLGLAIARRIAERHGFNLTVENRADGLTGVVARVLIPPQG